MIFLDILLVLLITLFGMWGGQQKKWIRRYMLPSLASLYVATKEKDKKKRWKAVLFLPLMGILSLGYGENSKLRKALGGSDFWTRIVYGLLVSIPFLFFGKWWASIALPIAWSIRAGAFPITKTKQFLWEDFIRYGTIGLLIIL